MEIIEDWRSGLVVWGEGLEGEIVSQEIFVVIKIQDNRFFL